MLTGTFASFAPPPSGHVGRKDVILRTRANGSRPWALIQMMISTPSLVSQCSRRLLPLLLIGALAAAAPAAKAEDVPKPGIKSESFDTDPGWEGHNNRMKPTKVPTVHQDFGYSNTSFAAKSPGEM